MSETTLVDYFICGGFGAICLVFVGHPFDTIKVRLQTMPAPEPGEPPKYKSTWDCVQKTCRKEGIRGFYQGLGAPLTSTVPIFAVSFLGYGMGEKLFSPLFGEKLINLTRLFAGGFSGIFTTIIMAPAERIKCLLQIQEFGGPKLYSGTFDCMIKLFKEGGITGVYRGSGATLVRDIPSSAVYFITYYVIKDYLTDFGKKKISFLGTVLAGGSAGVTFWIVGIPADVLKSRLQTAPTGTYPNGIVSVFVELMKTDGPYGLFRGIVAVSMRAFPANAACFVGIEICQKFLNWLYGILGISKNETPSSTETFYSTTETFYSTTETVYSTTEAT